MEQFKDLPTDQRYRQAWHWLHGYLEEAYNSEYPLTQSHLRELLDRMEEFADVLQPVTGAQVDATLDLATGVADAYQFAWLVMIGYFEGAYHYGRKGLQKPDLHFTLSKIKQLTPSDGNQL